jgi:hypothetical protein
MRNPAILVFSSVGPDGSLVTGGLACTGTDVACSAFIDPTITVASGLLLYWSPGIGNVASAVPEPSTWAMMILGFVEIGGLKHRRGQNAAAFL